MMPNGMDVCALWLLASGKRHSHCEQRSTIVKSPVNHIPWSSAVNHLPQHPLGLTRLRTGGQLRPSTARHPATLKFRVKSGMRLATSPLEDFNCPTFQAFGLYLPYVRDWTRCMEEEKEVCVCVCVCCCCCCCCCCSALYTVLHSLPITENESPEVASNQLKHSSTGADQSSSLEEKPGKGTSQRDNLDQPMIQMKDDEDELGEKSDMGLCVY